MMFSATDFLPDSIKTLTNLATSVLPNFGSGRISRLGTSRRRGISIPFSLQLRLLPQRSRVAIITNHLLDHYDRFNSINGQRSRPAYFLPALARFVPCLERAFLRSFTP